MRVLVCLLVPLAVLWRLLVAVPRRSAEAGLPVVPDVSTVPADPVPAAPSYAEPGGFAEVALRHHGKPWPEVQWCPGEGYTYLARDRAAGVEVRADALDAFDEVLRRVGAVLPQVRATSRRAALIRPYYRAWEQQRERQAREEEAAELAVLARYAPGAVR